MPATGKDDSEEAALNWLLEREPHSKLLIFDDTIEREAWNDSADDRVVLINAIWRPELTEREREELKALFRT